MPRAKTKLEIHSEKKKELHESEEYLSQIDKHGRKYFMEVQEAEVAADKRKKDIVLDDFESKKDRRFTYRRALADFGQKKLDEIDYPTGWEHYCLATGDGNLRLYGRHFKGQAGVLIVLKAPDGRVFSQGTRLSLNPEIDMGAVAKLVLFAENRIDSEKGILLSDKRDEVTGMKKTKSGLLLPD